MHYPAAYQNPMPHKAIGGTHTKQLLCSAHGVCGAPTSLDPWLNWRGGPPLGVGRGRVACRSIANGTTRREIEAGRRTVRRGAIGVGRGKSSLC